MDEIYFKKQALFLLFLLLLGISIFHISYVSGIDSKSNSVKKIKTTLEKSTFTSFNNELIQITTNQGDNFNPSLFMDTIDRLWVVWGNGTGNDGVIWVSYATPPYTNWTRAFRLTHDPADDWNPVGMTDKSGISWIFSQSNRNGNYDIWYKTSSTNGQSWSQAYQLTSETIDETRPMGLVDHSDTIWVFFEVMNGGNKDIAYRKTQGSTRSWEGFNSIALTSSIEQEEIYDVCINKKGTI